MKNLFILIVLFFSACTPASEKKSTIVAFTGATILDGTAPPVTDAVLLVDQGKVLAAGSRRDVAIPEGAQVNDVSGKFIIPGLINSHGHVGEVKGIEGGHYSRENVLEKLELYARYGITTVVSLGGDKAEAEEFRAVNDSMTTGRARLYVAGTVITGKTPAEGNAVVDANHAMGVDIMKIRIDDNLGLVPKVPEEVYRAAIARSHELGYKFASHMYYLDDAKKLLDAGSDMMAHSVRDRPVDEDFIKVMKARNVCYCPTLMREVVMYVYADSAAFFKDPFFNQEKEFSKEVINPLLDPGRMKEVGESRAAKIYKQQLPVAMANLKALSDAGVPIVMGTDSGVPTRFMGYFEHLEMEKMVEAGLTPLQVLQSATTTAASCMGLKNVGSLQSGNWADFIVLDEDPLVDIKNTRKINAVYVSGARVSR